MNQRLYVQTKLEEEKTFLRKKKVESKNPICLNANKFFWSVLEENKDDDLPIVKLNEIQSNHFYDVSKHNNNQVIPIGDVLFEKKIQESIKSILCPNFLTDRNSLFSKLFENKFGKTGGNNDNLDCVYMHLLFPGEENEFDNIYTNGKKKDVFYEVGCKIFEINKIYK